MKDAYGRPYDIPEFTQDLSTLPQRMRYAAQVLTEATAHAVSLHRDDGVKSRTDWSSRSLVKAAELWEAQASLDALVEELGRALCEFELERPAGGRRYVARRLIESGWRRKEDPDD